MKKNPNDRMLDKSGEFFLKPCVHEHYAHSNRFSCTYLHEKIFLSSLSIFLVEDLQISFSRETVLWTFEGRGLCPVTYLQPLKISTFLQLIIRYWLELGISSLESKKAHPC